MRNNKSLFDFFNNHNLNNVFYFYLQYLQLPFYITVYKLIKAWW